MHRSWGPSLHSWHSKKIFFLFVKKFQTVLISFFFLLQGLSFSPRWQLGDTCNANEVQTGRKEVEANLYACPVDRPQTDMSPNSVFSPDVQHDAREEVRSNLSMLLQSIYFSLTALADAQGPVSSFLGWTSSYLEGAGRSKVTHVDLLKRRMGEEWIPSSTLHLISISASESEGEKEKRRIDIQGWKIIFSQKWASSRVCNMAHWLFLFRPVFPPGPENDQFNPTDSCVAVNFFFFLL